MEVHLCEQVKENCWNFYDSYGEICVHCGCCCEDPEVQAISRLQVLRRELEDQKNFDNWFDDPQWQKVQDENRKENIKHLEKQIAHYEEVLAKIEAERNKEPE